MTDWQRLKQLAQAATPGPWGACGDQRGGCSCGTVWSETAQCPVAKAETGEWGDDYPAIRITPGDGLQGTKFTIEAYREFVPYGKLPDGQGEKNAMFIGAWGPDVCLELLTKVEAAEERACPDRDCPRCNSWRAQSTALAAGESET